MVPRISVEIADLHPPWFRWTRLFNMNGGWDYNRKAGSGSGSKWWETVIAEVTMNDSTNLKSWFFFCSMKFVPAWIRAVMPIAEVLRWLEQNGTDRVALAWLRRSLLVCWDSFVFPLSFLPSSSSIPVDPRKPLLPATHTHRHTITHTQSHTQVMLWAQSNVGRFWAFSWWKTFQQEDLERCRNLEFDYKSYLRNCRGAGRDWKEHRDNTRKHELQTKHSSTVLYFWFLCFSPGFGCNAHPNPGRASSRFSRYCIQPRRNAKPKPMAQKR